MGRTFGTIPMTHLLDMTIMTSSTIGPWRSMVLSLAAALANTKPDPVLDKLLRKQTVNNSFCGHHVKSKL
jgi:hypothetical protein